MGWWWVWLAVRNDNVGKPCDQLEWVGGKVQLHWSGGVAVEGDWCPFKCPKKITFEKGLIFW